MAFLLYIRGQYAPWYIAYVLLFNMLVGPVFLAGSVTGERERRTLDLLLTTTISPWQILWGKLVSGLRVASVLTLFLMWPVLLATVLPVGFWGSLPTMFAYLLIVAMTCLTTGVTALACSVLFRKTSTSLIATYLVLVVLFTGPLAARFFAATFFAGTAASWQPTELAGLVSPFAATFHLPLDLDLPEQAARPGNLPLVFAYFLFAALYNAGLLGVMTRLFSVRWRVAE